LCGIAIVRLNLSSEQFYTLTPIEFDFAIKESTEIEKFKQRSESNRMRLQTFYLVKTLSMSELPFETPEEMMPFNWDEKQEPKDEYIFTDEDWNKLTLEYCKN
jgi:hypothetical protein